MTSELAERKRALELLRTAFPDYRIVFSKGRWVAVSAGSPPEVFFAESPSRLCGQLFQAQLRAGGTVVPFRRAVPPRDGTAEAAP
ncbi:hypothetical protein GCM10010156_71410 [Planobispora rosea]|uniref:DUF5678 domain-containing protein n=1 Tax=Planobispora rosea TaxID=35762 RepID=A0A8J3S7B8_PLARO|nr:hypothetical protein [Planobispora rosea]GGT03239.1 hypothetical protein GCM10010156_71410 [Planobispora rosea]GIH88628.1 hypothetical protein Pro02_70360 [Planobispora rosea]